MAETKTDAATAPAATESTTAAQPATQQQQPGAAPSASLYVGDLLPDVTEAILFEKFNSVGQVASIRVCRDTITRRSLGYAYVNFVNAADAENAINEFNYDPINGNPCRIMWSQRDPSVRRSGVGNIFIKNLHKDIDNKTLYDTLESFGEILSCKVVCNPDGTSRGYGFVHFATQEAADSAVENVNGMLLKDMKVYVGPFKTKAERVEDISKNAANFTNLFVKNFPKELNEEQLEEMFKPFGTVTSRKIMMAEDDSGSETSKGFGFVSFETTEAAQAAVTALNEKEVEGQKLYVGRAQKKIERLGMLRREYEQRRRENRERYQGVNLYVKNLADDVVDQQLREAFAEFGTITSAKVMRDEKNVSRGFGFVCFSQADEATKAVTEMNGRLLGSKPLYVALAQRKEERKQHLAMQHSRAQAMRMQGMYQQPGMPAMYMPQMAVPAVQQAPRGYYPQMGARPRGFPMQQPPQMIAMQPQFRPGMMGGPQNPRMMAGNRQGGPQNRRGAQPKGQYNRGQRNMPVQVQMTQGQAQGQMNVVPGAPPQPTQLQQPGQEPLTASALASADPEMQKQMLGERLFPQIARQFPEHAGKITGMLLEMDNSELLHLLEDANALKTKVDEAVGVLKEHARVQGQEISLGDK